MRKSLMYSFCIGIVFAGVHSSYAEYPDAKSLLRCLGIEIDEDGKPVANGSGGCLPEAWNTCLDILGKLNCDSKDDKRRLTEEMEEEDECSDDSSTCNDIQGKLNCLSIDKGTLSGKGRWHNEAAWPNCCDKKLFIDKVGMVVPEEDLDKIRDLLRSREFLTGVFGEDFVSAFLQKAADQKEKHDTWLASQLLFVRYYSLRKKYVECEVRFEDDCSEKGLNKRIKDALSKNVVCINKLASLREQLRSKIETCEKCLKEHVPYNQTSPLWESFEEFRAIVSPKPQPLKLHTAAENFWKKLENVPDLKDPNHPVRISFSKVQELLLNYPKASFVFLTAEQKLKYYEGRKTKLFEERLETELGNDIKEYRELFGSKGACESYRKLSWNKGACKSYPVSTEPLTIEMHIYQRHYEDKDDTQKLYNNESEKLTDLDIEIRLVIDTRTNELLEAFCDKQFILNGQVVTDFGDGLCIFKSKQGEDLIEDEK